MPASSKAPPPQQSKLEEMWGGKKKRKAAAVEVKSESDALDDTYDKSGKATLDFRSPGSRSRNFPTLSFLWS